MNARRIYLDVCALCRPFDDQNFLRIHLETTAINMILEKVKSDGYQLAFSPAHLHEISAINDTYIRVQIMSLLYSMGTICKYISNEVRIRSEELIVLGFGVADATHIAFSEASSSEFISCDDRLLKKYSKMAKGIWSGNPIQFIEKEGVR